MGKTSFYLSKTIEEKLRIDPDQGRGLSKVVSLTIDRYHELIDREKKAVSSILSKDEILTLCAVCNGTIFEPAANIRRGVLINLQDTYPEELPGFDIDKKALEEKLSLFTPVQEMALVEIIEDYWSDK